MMANNERKLAKPSLIPLEIDPASILSLSKGVIFDTIVHNVEYTLNNRRTDPLPWKLIGMSLICDPSRNKKYMQKLQKMQCVRSVIGTQIYHSKLVKTETGQLTTPGRKIILPTVPCKRLTGIFVCRSIDELLYMESTNTESVHFIQYKLLSYERIATRELINGPNLTSVDEKIIKTVFDFELSQQFDFPRQLLPVAIISFGRQEGCDLCSSIRNFLKLEDHKTFDKSYLVTSINVEFDRLREEDERKQDTEAEQAIIWEKIQRRPPLAELSKRTTDTGNTRTIPSPPRVPPLKVKLPRSDKPSVPNLSVDSNYQCSLQLDRIDLAEYDISNLLDIQTKEPTTTSTISIESSHTKTKPMTVNKPFEHQKQLKRLSSNENKQKLSNSSIEILTTKKNTDTKSERQSTGTLKITIPMNATQQRSTSSSSSMSPIYRPKSTIPKQSSSDKTTTKKKVKRPVLPSDYYCSLNLSRIDLSQYDLDLPPPPFHSTETQLSETLSSFELSKPPDNSSNEQENFHRVTTDNTHERNESNSTKKRKTIDSDDIDNRNLHKHLLNIVDGFSTPDLNEMESNDNEEIVISLNEKPVLSSSTSNESLPTLTDEIVTQAVNSIVINVSEALTSNSISPPPTSPPHQNSSNNIPSEDYIIIVPCSDDELENLDDDDDFFINNINSNTISKDSGMQINDPSPIPLPPPPSLPPPLLPPNPSIVTSPLRNPSLTRILTIADRLQSDRLSISSLSSSCSSISTSILHPHSPQAPLNLTAILIPQRIVNKNQAKSPPLTFAHFDTSIPILAQESLVDPRLIYRLKTITTDLHWPSPCVQCRTCPYTIPDTFNPTTQTILFERNSSTDFVDPRREPLKNAVLNDIFQRFKRLLPNIILMNSNQFQKILFEQTIFQTNCSLHLEYLLHKIKQTDDTNFLQMIKTNEEFQLPSNILQLISN